MKCFKYRHIISHLCQIACAGESGWSGTDHSYLMTVLFFCTFWFDVMLQCIICHKTLQFSDGYRISFDTTDTLSFTLRLLRADTSTDCRKCGRLSDDLVCFLDISFLYFLNKCRNIDRYRTSFDTFCIFTIQASCCLFHCLFLIISKTNFFKICCTYFWILFSDRYSHHSFCHYSSPPQCPHPP